MLTSRITTPAVAKDLTFPCLMENNGANFIILVESCDNNGVMSGMVIYSPDRTTIYKVGHYSHNWIKSGFKLFKGEVLIKED